ncbi:hemicentin-1-like isoform X2 [Anneissia japonica]|nr:hemicentin-1-like isoform X2 [Anneissia japonica]
MTVDPATAKLGEDAMMVYTFTPATGESLDYVSWFKSDAAGREGNVIITNRPRSGTTELNGRYSLSDNGSLIIRNVVVENAGYYLCRATTSPYGETADGFSNLTVYYLETPMLSPTEIYVNGKKSTTFTCPFPDGVPTPITITWIKDDSVLDVSDTEKYPQSDTTLEISRVNKMDEGDYQCRAENAAYNKDEGKLSNIGTLSLFASPSTTSIGSSFSVVPSLTSIASISATVPQECSGSNTGLLVGLTFLSFFLGVLLSSSISVVLGKIRNPKAQVTKGTSRHYEEPAELLATPRDKQALAYMAYKRDSSAEEKTYEDLEWNDDNPVAYINVKANKENT